jgi:uncharacterized linocin/CFP29 family protein
MNGASVTPATNTPPNPDPNTTLAQTQASGLRVVRQALQPVIGQGYTASVPGHRISRQSTLSVKPNQNLQPLQISRHFLLYKEQANDTATLNALIAFAAADIAQAEDAVLLLGAEAGPSLARLQVEVDQDELKRQVGLLEKGSPAVGKPILDSILEGIKTLRARAQGGDYYVIVSPDLYEEAYKNRKTTVDAPVYQIQPLLANQGFLCSGEVPPKSGVILSLARNSISLSVPMDTYVDTSLPNDNQGRTKFAVAEQFRLVIDDPEARVQLE